MRYFLGCPIWNHRPWLGSLFTRHSNAAQFLRQYATVFNAVEGNSTFYGLPRPEAIQRWREETPPQFQFCCKFPKIISHELRLHNAQPETKQFLGLMELLGERAGVLFLQLPPSFSPAESSALRAYLHSLPAGFHYALEVRHPAWFDKGEHEQRLHDWLRAAGIERVLLDSRALFSAPAYDEPTRLAQGKKPRVPLHVTALGTKPLIRFIGRSELADNQRFLKPWVEKIALWIEQGLTPYVFIHTPNNNQAPELARQFHQQLQQRLPSVGALPPSAVAQELQLGLF